VTDIFVNGIAVSSAANGVTATDGMVT